MNRKKHASMRTHTGINNTHTTTLNPFSATKPVLLHTWTTLAAKSKFQPAQLARLCGVSIRTLERQFLRSLKKSPREWLSARRMETAASRIQASSELIKTIAFELGFTHPNNFARTFKHATRMTPAEFRRHLLGCESSCSNGPLAPVSLQDTSLSRYDTRA